MEMADRPEICLSMDVIWETFSVENHRSGKIPQIEASQGN
jgi:hypothetical protein